MLVRLQRTQSCIVCHPWPILPFRPNSSIPFLMTCFCKRRSCPCKQPSPDLKRRPQEEIVGRRLLLREIKGSQLTAPRLSKPSSTRPVP